MGTVGDEEPQIEGAGVGVGLGREPERLEQMERRAPLAAEDQATILPALDYQYVARHDLLPLEGMETRATAALSRTVDRMEAHFDERERQMAIGATASSSSPISPMRGVFENVSIYDSYATIQEARRRVDPAALNFASSTHLLAVEGRRREDNGVLTKENEIQF